MMTNTNIYVISGRGKYYVGKSNDPKRRFSQHKRDAKKGPSSRKRDWIKRYEHHLSINTLEVVSATKWREREQYWINHYCRKYGDDAIMNSTIGGDGPLMEEEIRDTTSGANTFFAFILLVSGVAISFTGVGVLVGIPMIIAASRLMTK